MKKTEPIDDWLVHATASQERVETIHFDRLLGGENIFGLELVKYSHAILESVLKFLSSTPHAHGIKYTLVFIPFKCSEDFLVWSNEVWGSLGFSDESPSLYIVRNENIFDDESEEYRYPAPLPIGYKEPFRAVFRSFRNQEAIANSWEFTSGVYLIYPVHTMGSDDD